MAKLGEPGRALGVANDDNGGRPYVGPILKRDKVSTRAVPYISLLKAICDKTYRRSEPALPFHQSAPRLEQSERCRDPSLGLRSDEALTVR